MTITTVCQNCHKKFESEKPASLCGNCEYEGDDSDSSFSEIVEDICDVVSDFFDSDD